MNCIKTLLKRHMLSFWANESGNAIIELAFGISLLMILFFGAVEVTRFVLITQKLQDAANAETNVITSINPALVKPTQYDMNYIIEGVHFMMTPYVFGPDDMVIISDIYYPPPDPLNPSAQGPVVSWRYCSANVSPSGTTLSKFGKLGGKADLSSLPAAGGKPFSLKPEEEIVAVEMYYHFFPMIPNKITNSMVSSKTLYSASISVPRFGSLSTLGSTSFTSNCH